MKRNTSDTESKTFAVRLPERLRRELNKLAEKDAISLSAKIRQILMRAIREEDAA